MNNNQLTCDPVRIELFLGQQLSEDEQAAFESHLDDCGECRSRLESAAAGEDVWVDVRESLRKEPDGAESGDHFTLESAAGDIPRFNHDAVLRLLAPTDDERMLGRLGSYEVVGVIGSGGMGVVLKAFDASLNRYVAIKVLAPHLGSSGAARKRFSREAQAAAAVVQENVIEIYGVDDASELPYLVMPYLRGPSLQRRLDDEGPLDVAEILRIGMQAASGLAAAHAQGLVHRDVKPANIMLADGIERVKLTDFGLARAADDASLTMTGIIAGTPQYMSPEQARGETVDQRSDLFSLGSVLYAMCTGRAPFRAETSYGVLRRINDEEPRPIREINPAIPDWLCRIVAKLMLKEPADRFASAQEVAELLESCLAHVQQPTVVPLPQSTRKSSGVLKGVIAMSAAVVLGLLGLVFAQVTEPDDISGKWNGEGWGNVELTPQKPGTYAGTYTDTFEGAKGTIQLSWSRIERRYKGTWGQGKSRHGKLSVRRVEDEIRGAWTTSKKSGIQPGNPELADLVWKRGSKNDEHYEIFFPEWKEAGDPRAAYRFYLEVARARDVDEAAATKKRRQKVWLEGLLKILKEAEDADLRRSIASSALGLANAVEDFTASEKLLLQLIELSRSAKEKDRWQTELDGLRQRMQGRNNIESAQQLTLSFDKAPYSDVIELLGKRLGIPVQFDTRPNGTFSYKDEKPMSVSDALDILRNSLASQNLTILHEPGRLRVCAVEEDEKDRKVLSALEAVKDGMDLYHKRKKVVVRVHVGSINSIKVTDPIGGQHQNWDLVPKSTSDFTIRITPEAQKALAQRGVADISRSFVGKTVEAEGFVVGTALNLYGRPDTIWTYHMDLTSLDQLRFVNGGKRDDPLEPAEAADQQSPAKRLQGIQAIESAADAEEIQPDERRRLQLTWREPVRFLACTPDGQRFAIANGTPTLILQAGGTSQLKDNWRPLVEIVNASDGKTGVKIEVSTKEEEAILAATKYASHLEVTALEFSPDGSTLAVGTNIGQIKLFDARTGELIRQFDDERPRLADKETPENWKPLRRTIGSVRSLAFSPDGSSLAVCGDSFSDFSDVFDGIENLGLAVTAPGRLKVWDVKTGGLVHDLAGHSHAEAVAFSPDGKLLASAGRWSGRGGEDNGAILWDVEAGAKTRTIPESENGGTRAVAFSPDGKLLALGSQRFDKDKLEDASTGTVTVVHAATGIVEWKRTVPGWAMPLAFTFEGRTIAALSKGRSVYLLDVSTGSTRHELRTDDALPGGRWSDFAIIPPGGKLAVGGADKDGRGNVQVWEFSAADSPAD